MSADPFDDLLTANRSYAHEFPHAGLSSAAAKGLAVLTCIDSRIDPLAMLGLVPGDAKILRNAGARATDDAIRSLAIATQTLRVTRIAVVAHSDCAAATSDAELRARLHGVPDDMDLGVAPDQVAMLVRDVARIREHPAVPDSVAVAGFVYDVHSGRVVRASDVSRSDRG